MTTWSAVKIAGFVKGAGFTQDEVPMATAVAWAASQGADHYAYNPGLTSASERRGLFAMRVDEVPDGDGHLLWNPDYSAKAARRFYLAGGGSWMWHPAVISGTVNHALDLVTAVLAGKVRTVSESPVQDFRIAMEARVKWARAMADSRRRPV